MIINNIQIAPGTELEKELSILTRDTHTPSGLLIHKAFEISSSTSVGFGDIYKIKPASCPSDIATSVYKELTLRAPALLDALLETAEKDSPFLEVDVQNNATTQHGSFSSHKRLRLLPILIAWMVQDPRR